MSAFEFDGMIDDFDGRMRLANVARMPRWQARISRLCQYAAIVGVPLLALLLAAIAIGSIARIGALDVAPAMNTSPAGPELLAPVESSAAQ